MKRCYYLLRRWFFTMLSFLMSRNKAVFSCTINGFSRFDKRTFFGKNNHFNGCLKLGQGRVKFGDNVHTAVGLKILTSYHNYLGSKIPYDTSVVIKDVEIGDNVWIGLDVIILGGVKIGEGAIIQAGSVVSTSIPALGIAGGNPAKVFKQRDEQHYYGLKASNQVM